MKDSALQYKRGKVFYKVFYIETIHATGEGALMGKMEVLRERIEIADRVKKIRLAKGVTQQALAEKIGLSTVTYVKLENAAHNITTKNLKKLSRIFGVTTDLILFGDTGLAHYNFDEYIRCAQFFNSDELESFKSNLELVRKLQDTSEELMPL